jgi:hypothetical protein
MSSPECGQACTCNGDIDDCFFDDDASYMKCRHYLECEREGDDDYWEPEDEVCAVCAEYGRHAENCPRRGVWK